MPTFYQPKFYQNALADVDEVFTYVVGSAKERCLKPDCSPLGPDSIFYTTATSINNDGGWIPVVSSQSELNANFAQIVASTLTCFLFFKVVGSTTILHVCYNLAEGFTGGVQLPVQDKPAEKITLTNIGISGVQVNENDGPVIVIGIIDSGTSDK